MTIEFVTARFNHGRWINRMFALKRGESQSMRIKRAFSEQSFNKVPQ